MAGANKIFLEYGNNPLRLFETWLAEAEKSEINDPNAMALATVDGRNRPGVRMVLLKGFDERGFVFYTNIASAKGRALAVHPHAELNFHWKSLERQVRVSGPVEKTTDAESDAYFASRPRESRIGAWASRQSERLESYAALKEKYAEMEKKFVGVENIPRPDFWGGYRLAPERMEFWIADPHRLHERFVYEKNDKGAWEAVWLFP